MPEPDQILLADADEVFVVGAEGHVDDRPGVSAKRGEFTPGFCFEQSDALARAGGGEHTAVGRKNEMHVRRAGLAQRGPNVAAVEVREDDVAGGQRASEPSAVR